MLFLPTFADSLKKWVSGEKAPTVDQVEKASKAAENLLLIGRGITIQVNIIRSAEKIRIHANALSHSHYCRIVGAARQYKKPIRYFTCASDCKGTLLVMKADR